VNKGRERSLQAARDPTERHFYGAA
jgi:hypothetical protein